MVAWVNDVITIECLVINAAPSDVTWSRVESPLENNVEVIVFLVFNEFKLQFCFEFYLFIFYIFDILYIWLIY